jgi:hypothetical protein
VEEVTLQSDGLLADEQLLLRALMLIDHAFKSVSDQLRAELAAQQLDVPMIAMYIPDEMGQLLDPLVVLRNEVIADDVIHLLLQLVDVFALVY